MSELNLYSPLFHDKGKAREFIEELLWPNGAVCAHCEQSDRSRGAGKKVRESA